MVPGPAASASHDYGSPGDADTGQDWELCPPELTGQVWEVPLVLVALNLFLRSGKACWRGCVVYLWGDISILFKRWVWIPQTSLAFGYSPPGSSVHGILQARILEWVAISSSRGDRPNLGIELGSPALPADFLPSEPPGKPQSEWSDH